MDFAPCGDRLFPVIPQQNLASEHRRVHVASGRLQPIQERRTNPRGHELSNGPSVRADPGGPNVKMSCMVMTSPAIPVTSVTPQSFLAPPGGAGPGPADGSPRRNCWRIARTGSSNPAINDHRFHAQRRRGCCWRGWWSAIRRDRCSSPGACPAFPDPGTRRPRFGRASYAGC